MDPARAALQMTQPGFVEYLPALVVFAILLVGFVMAGVATVVWAWRVERKAKAWVEDIVTKKVPDTIKESLQNGIRAMVTGIFEQKIREHEEVEQKRLIDTVIPTVTGCRDELERKAHNDQQEMLRRLETHDRRLASVEASIAEIARGRRR